MSKDYNIIPHSIMYTRALPISKIQENSIKYTAEYSIEVTA